MARGDRRGRFYTEKQFQTLLGKRGMDKIRLCLTSLVYLQDTRTYAGMFHWTRQLNETLEKAAQKWLDGALVRESRKHIQRSQLPRKATKHTLNCCGIHRYCKYEDETCPVVKGKQRQISPCRCSERVMFGVPEQDPG